METLFFILLGLAGITGIILLLRAIEENEIKWYWVLLLLLAIIALSVSMTLTGATIEKQCPRPVHSKEFTVKTEIHIETIDGQETLRDTVYTFTPNK